MDTVVDSLSVPLDKASTRFAESTERVDTVFIMKFSNSTKFTLQSNFWQGSGKKGRHKSDPPEKPPALH